MASYPTSVKSFTSRSAGDVIQPAHVNDLQDEVNAIEAGLLNGTAQLNSSNSTLARLSVTGGSTLTGLQVNGNSTVGSTITIGTLPYIFPSAGGSTGALLTISSTSGSTMTLAWQAAAAVTTVISLVKSSNGTATQAGATTVDSVAISGLTANDTLRVVTTLESSSQATGQVTLYSVTDAVAIITVSPTPIVANGSCMCETILRQRDGSATNIAGTTIGMQGGPATYTDYALTAVTTAWTGSWTLGLRHGGVTAGGTFKYAWSVHKVAGQ